MGVAVFDANATAPTVLHTVANITNSGLTVGAGANRALIAELSVDVTTISAITVTWDELGTPQTVTSIGSASGTGGRVDVFGLVAPTSGNKQARAHWTTNAGDAFFNVHSWSSVDQTGGVTSFPHFNSATGVNTPKVTLTSAVGNATTAAVAADAAISAPTQTQLFLDNTGSNVNAAATRAAGAATVVHQWTQTGNWVVAGTDIAAASSAGIANGAHCRPFPFTPGSPAGR